MSDHRAIAVSLSRTPWYVSTARYLRYAFVLFTILGLGILPRQVSTAQTNWQWFKTDLHVHSVISSEAYTDLGIISQSAKSLGYNALFLTDHNLASDFPVSSLTANNMAFEDSYVRWALGSYGSPTSTTNALVTTPVATGTNSLQLASSASGYGETYVWTNRGPNFRSGDIILRFSVYPTRIDAGSGVYVSASIGGDVSVQTPNGYTTSGGVITPGKSIVLVWQLGTPRAASSDPNRRVLTYPLAYTLNTWNHYEINISERLADIPAAELPLDYNGLTYLKMAAAANGGTAAAYFDTYSITALSPVPPAEEFVYRNSVISSYDTSTFKIFPSLEMGVRKHAQRLNFGITNPSEFVSYWNGVDGILPAQQSGYPAMLNHPGSAGGVDDEEAISTQGFGADLIEVREQGWIDNWDAILKQGVQLLGAGTTDTHRVFSSSSFATYVYGTELTFDSLVRSIFEGRTYIAPASFGDQGRLIFNVDSASQEPYPVRYPIYVPATQTSANVHLSVTGGLKSGYTVRWIRDGVLMSTDITAGTSYETTKNIPLNGTWTYVRAEVRSSSGSLQALTQPLVFVSVPGLPADMNYHIDHVTTSDGRQYTKLFVKGITAFSWDVGKQVLALTLNDPAGALVDLRMSTGSSPQSIQMDGLILPVADSLAAFQAASGPTWYYNSSSRLLHLKVLHAGETSMVSVWFTDSGITPTATTRIFTDTPTRTATGTGTNTLTSTSTRTATATKTRTATSTQPGWLTFTPVADSSVKQSSPATNYGTSTTLWTNTSPIARSYLRFNVQGLNAAVKRATLRIYAQTGSTSGYVVNSLKDNTWGELSLNYTNAPPATGQIGFSGSVMAGTWTTFDVTPYIPGNSTFNVMLTGLSSSELSLASRESGANAPQLVIETGAGMIRTSTSTPIATFLQTSTATRTRTATPSRTSTSTATGYLSTLVPVADSYVNEGNPTSNYGTVTSLRLDASPLVRSYLRFDVQGLSGTIRRATLRMFTNNSSNAGFEVRPVTDNTWTELAINHNNAPVMGSVTATSGAFGAGAWTTVDITPLITGNGSFNIGLTTTSSTAFVLASSESGANAPQLIIETVP